MNHKSEVGVCNSIEPHIQWSRAATMPYKTGKCEGYFLIIC